MLGTDVCTALRERGHEVFGTGRREGLLPLDITDTLACWEAVSGAQPDAVVHCAAWTDVDGAERTPEDARRLNVLGTWNIAAAAAQAGATLVAISTDFVFDGMKPTPYDEFDPTNPLGVYGATKEQAEQLVRQLLPDRHLIVRTSWLYGAHGKNFVKTILRLADTAKELPVVADQVGCPTYTVDAARKIADLLEAPLMPGTYHVCNQGVCSWFEFARRIATEGGRAAKVVPLTAVEYAARFRSPTRRPANSALRRLSLELRNMDDLPPWQNALSRYLQELKEAR